MSKRDEMEGRLSQKASELASWRGLVDHPGWNFFKRTMQEQRNARILVLSEPSSGLSTILAQEFMKGEASGLFTAMEFPEMQIQLLKSEVGRLQLQIEMEESHDLEDRKRADDAGRVDNDVEWHGGGVEPEPSTGGPST